MAAQEKSLRPWKCVRRSISVVCEVLITRIQGINILLYFGLLRVTNENHIQDGSDFVYRVNLHGEVVILVDNITNMLVSVMYHRVLWLTDSKRRLN